MSLLSPVKIFHLNDKSVEIKEGSIADIAAFDLLEGDYIYVDAEDNRIQGKYKLEPRFTVLREELFMAA
jgi:predicted amidohydrolase